MTYREFILTLHDDVSPEESKVLFEEYLADWYGSSIKAEFEARKGEAWYVCVICCSCSIGGWRSLVCECVGLSWGCGCVYVPHGALLCILVFA